ncbi:prolyl oligopeptidase family serine peptidase [Galbibacter sp.]|uniref:prolyl oligopeptidase family serine peptidase n=1 Tax=Galbibacter sp. TaxID=2918471 RepID=UPI002BD5AED0|nr:prolyl oligopeptidase family serine peptidase [Galbibacter sp.]HLV62579.1 prolyl oligopeptidase family serine peptidase [Galbibacter sp.]
MKYRGLIMVVSLFLMPFLMMAQDHATYKIWETIPNTLKVDIGQEHRALNALGELERVSNVSEPTLEVFLPKRVDPSSAAVLICPGGGYAHLAIDKEGYKLAKWFNSIGIAAMVLKYRLPNQAMADKKNGPLQDAQQAIRFIRSHAKQWNIDQAKVGVMGFSAGGHLAASLSTMYDNPTYRDKLASLSARPDFSILIYPVISMEDDFTHKGSQENLLGKKASKALKRSFSPNTLVDAKTPPAFLVHATDDKAVPVENSLLYYKALKKSDVSTEIHIYKDGGHGFGMGNTVTNKQWTAALKYWLEANEILSNEKIYLFSYFKSNGEDGLHYAYSTDGFTWQALKGDNSFLTPHIGKEKLMRDPCIIKGGDGKYHMVWTCGWTEKGIGYASSMDLIHWSDQQYVPVMEHEENARNSWAPELTYDHESGTYMIYWATTIKGAYPATASSEENGYNHRIYYTTTKDFKTFSKTALLYEPGFNVIDASILYDNGRYIMFLKDETRVPAAKNIRIAYSDNLTGPYSQASAPITGDYWAEGPTSLKIDDLRIVYFDKYIDKQYGGVQSTDLIHWIDISDKLDFPKGMRHGSVLELSSQEFFKNFIPYMD